MAQGKVKWFNEAKGFGFIETEEGQDIFMHYSEIIGTSAEQIFEGLEVNYDIIESDSGPHAKNIRFMQRVEGAN